MDIYKEPQERRTEILAIAAKHGAYNVRVFGLVARHEADSASDLDLLVGMEPERSLLDLGGLLMDLQDLLGCHVDVVTEKGFEGASGSASSERQLCYERRPGMVAGYPGRNREI
ncbi:MAG: nucleotidyltransferase domain-containing protein [Methanothrix sp.]|nr:nucleotidyltransferase domain-containing protein [Methanothrix sp.]